MFKVKGKAEKTGIERGKEKNTHYRIYNIKRSR